MPLLELVSKFEFAFSGNFEGHLLQTSVLLGRALEEVGDPLQSRKILAILGFELRQVLLVYFVCAEENQDFFGRVVPYFLQPALSISECLLRGHVVDNYRRMGPHEVCPREGPILL